MHLVKVLTENIGEVLEQLLHLDDDGSHGSSGLRIPGVTILLGGRPPGGAARADGGARG